MVPSKLSRRFQLHWMAHSQHAWLYTHKKALKTLPIASDGTLPACLIVRSQVSSHDAPNCTRKHTPSLHDCMLRNKVIRRSEAHGRTRFEVDSQSHLTIYAVGRFILILAELQMPSTAWRVAGGGWHMMAEIMTSVDIIVCTFSLAFPSRSDLTMPHGHGVEECSGRFCRKDRQLDIRESRSWTQIVQRNMLLASHHL
jgi:hypothetical protein